MFSIYLILPVALGPEVYSASNRISIRNRKVISKEQSAADA
jgi:hypothetical protein